MQPLPRTKIQCTESMQVCRKAELYSSQDAVGIFRSSGYATCKVDCLKDRVDCLKDDLVKDAVSTRRGTVVSPSLDLNRSKKLIK